MKIKKYDYIINTILLIIIFAIAPIQPTLSGGNNIDENRLFQNNISEQSENENNNTIINLPNIQNNHNSDRLTKTEIEIDYIQRDVIMISSDDDFLEFPGSGTKDDPFVIEGFNITKNPTRSLITIKQTSVFFIIRNNYLSSKIGGIELFKVSNGKIDDNVIKNGINGINLLYSSEISISSNEITNNEIGISITWTSNTTMSNNTITNNTRRGILLSSSENNFIFSNTLSNNNYAIYLFRSSNNKQTLNTIINNSNGIGLKSSSDNIISKNNININRVGINLDTSPNNTMKDNILNQNGLNIEGSSLSQYLQKVVINNTVNGKKLIYWVNRNEMIVPDNVGQIIIINSTNIQIRRQELIAATTGIQLITSSNTYIHNNNIQDNVNFGIKIFNSKNNILISNNINKNFEGLYLSSSINNTIKSNIISNNSWNGLFLRSSSNNSITSNTIKYNNLTGTSFSIGSSGNEIKYNNYISNYIQVIDQERNHFSYNYWDNWTEPDGDKDGIVDDSYEISKQKANFDQYPKTVEYPRQIDLTPPIVSEPEDLEIIIGTQEKIMWTIGDVNPAVYYIKSGISFYKEFTLWSNGSITIDVNQSSIGIYSYTIFIYDIAGNLVYDVVIVRIVKVKSIPVYSSTTTTTSLIIPTTEPVTDSDIETTSLKLSASNWLFVSLVLLLLNLSRIVRRRLDLYQF